MKGIKGVKLVAVTLACVIMVHPLAAQAASAKMITKSTATAVTSSAAFASTTSSKGAYEFKPNTNKTLTGSIKEYSASRYLQAVVASTKYNSRATGSFKQVANNSYKVYLSSGYGYGVVTVQ